MKVTPCMNCEERHIGCHSICEKYLSMRENLNKRNKIINENKRKELDVQRLEKEGKLKTIKRKK